MHEAGAQPRLIRRLRGQWYDASSPLASALEISFVSGDTMVSINDAVCTVGRDKTSRG